MRRGSGKREMEGREKNKAKGEDREEGEKRRRIEGRLKLGTAGSTEPIRQVGELGDAEAI